MKKLLAACFGLFLFLGSVLPVLAQGTIDLYFFSAQGCPHCAQERVFLEKLIQENSNVVVHELEITRHQENAALLRYLGESWQVDVSGVPFTVIGRTTVTGFLNEATTGKQIEEVVAAAGQEETKNWVAAIANDKGLSPSETLIRSSGDQANDDSNQVPIAPGLKPQLPSQVTIPLFGPINLKELSLPLITIVLALLDGFNPCAMWVLLFLISLLLGMKDRRKMWLLGGTFLLASALVYFLFLAAWLNVLLFLGFIIWIRLLVGLVALGAGGYYLRDFWVNREGKCTVIEPKKRQRWFDRMRLITRTKHLLLAMAGMVALAFGVNLVELVCSAGLPAVYTQILTLNPLPVWHYYLYLLLYIFVFLLDDLLIFTLAMVTLRAAGIQGKYSRFSHLVGGLAMLLIGLLLWFRPEWLMFG